MESRRNPLPKNDNQSPNNLLVELGDWKPSIVANGPEPSLKSQLLRSTLFTAQATARDMIANGREDEIEEIRRHISRIAPKLPPSREEDIGYPNSGSSKRFLK